MPYKDPEVRKAFKAKWWKEFRATHPSYHREQMKAWRLTQPKKVESPEEELARLVKEQAKDARIFRVKHDPGLQAREDEVYGKYASL